MQEYADVYQEMFKFTQKLVLRRGVRLRDVEDVASEIMLTLLEKWSEYDHTRPLETYVYTLAVRRVSDYHDRKREELFGGGAEPHYIEDSQWCPQDQHCIVKQELERAGECIDETVIEHFTGEPVTKMSTDPEIPVNTLYSRLRRSRQRVRAQLKRADRVFMPVRETEHPTIAQRWQKWGERWMRSIFDPKRNFMPAATVTAIGAELRRVRAKARRDLAIAYMNAALRVLAPRHLRTLIKRADNEVAELAAKMIGGYRQRSRPMAVPP